MGVIHDDIIDSYINFDDEQQFQNYLDSVDKYIEAAKEQEKYMEYLEKYGK